MSFKINNKIYYSNVYNDNIFIGNYYEKHFFNWYNENININNKLLHCSVNNRYSHFDFTIKTNNIINLIELKSRYGKKENHNYCIIDCLKINEIIKIKDKYLNNDNVKRKINIIFIFNFVDNTKEINGTYTTDYYYYIIDENYLKSECDIEQRYNKDCYILPINNIIKIDKEFNNIL